jgi:hypothetical protein
VESVRIAPLPGSGLQRDRVAGNPRPGPGARRAAAQGGLSETLERTSTSVTRARHDTGAAAELNSGLSEPRTVTPALPRTFFGGVRVVF